MCPTRRVHDLWTTDLIVGRVAITLEDAFEGKRQTNTGLTFDGAAGFRRSNPSRPSVGSEFSDSIARKIGQPREHRAEVVAEG
jgi:hypothetical protein